MQDSTEHRIKQIMADLFHLDAHRIDGNTAMDNTERWDSANHVSLIFALEEEFSISFDVAEIEAMSSFFDIVQAVAAKI